jgi:hypothetical protein
MPAPERPDISPNISDWLHFGAASFVLELHQLR